MLPLALALVVAAAPAHKAQADRLFAQGRKLLAEGRVKEACAAFDKSNTLLPALGALLNLAECEALLGNSARAYSLYQSADEWSRRVGNTARAQVAAARLADLAPKVALLEVDPPSGAEVLVDAQAATADRPIALTPGTHSVIWTEGGRSVSRSLDLKAGERRTLRGPPEAEAEPEPKVDEKPPPADEPVAEPVRPRLTPVEPARPPAEPPAAVAAAEPSSARRGLGVTLVVVGAAALVASAFGLAWSLDVQRRVAQQQPGQPDFDRPTVTQATYSLAGMLYPVSWVALGTGAALTVGGAALWMSAGPSPGAGGGLAVGGSFPNP